MASKRDFSDGVMGFTSIIINLMYAYRNDCLFDLIEVCKLCKPLLLHAHEGKRVTKITFDSHHVTQIRNIESGASCIILCCRTAMDMHCIYEGRYRSAMMIC